MNFKSKKIGIIGSGFVGTTFAYASMIRNLASEILLFDIDSQKAIGEAMDLSHGLMFVETGNIFAVDDLSMMKDVDVVVITAGRNQKPNESRLELVNQNAKIMRDIIKSLDKYCPDAILLIVSNPVDILTQVASNFSKRDKNKIIGAGTVLDTSRLKTIISKKINISPHSIDGFVIGEHGDSEVVLWSSVSAGNMPLDYFGLDDDMKKEISKEVCDSAYEIIEKKEATYYGIGLALCEIVESIFYNQNMILTVSVKSDIPEYRDTYFSLPAVIGKSGIEKILNPRLSDSEEKLLFVSIEKLKNTFLGLDLS